MLHPDLQRLQRQGIGKKWACALVNHRWYIMKWHEPGEWPCPLTGPNGMYQGGHYFTKMSVSSEAHAFEIIDKLNSEFEQRKYLSWSESACFRPIEPAQRIRIEFEAKEGVTLEEIQAIVDKVNKEEGLT